MTYLGASNIISALGFSTAENVANVEHSVSGITAYGHGAVAAQIDRERLAEAVKCHSLEKHTTLEQLMILSVMDVIESSGLDMKSSDTALIFSTTKGNIELLAAANDLTDERIYLWKMAERVAAYFGAVETPIVVSNACISGVTSVILASRMIREGRYKNIIIVGADLLTDFVVSGFGAFKSLSSNACRPYDAARDGLTLGEACASLLVTADPTLSCGVVVEGGDVSNDANHISGPSRTGDGLSYAVLRALAQSDLQPSDVTFVNAHGTATLFNDEMESKAINLSGLQHVPVSSLKSYFGHTLGAAGVLELVMCVEQLRCGVLYATAGFETLGVPKPIRVSGVHIPMAMQRCVKCASGFGGCNAAVVLSLEECTCAVKTAGRKVHRNVSECSIAEGRVMVNGIEKYTAAEPFVEFVRGAFKALDRPNMKFYKMDDLCKLGYLTAEHLLADSTYASSELAIVLANSSSSLDSDIRHQQILDQHLPEGASPAVFVYTLPNVVLGEICIRHKIQGENTFFVNQTMPRDFIENYAQMLMDQIGYKAVVYGWCEKIGEHYDSKMILIEND